MTKMELIKWLDNVPDDAEGFVADYSGEDMALGDVVYFPEEKLFWLRTEDLIAQEDDDTRPEIGMEPELDEAALAALGGACEAIVCDPPLSPRPSRNVRQRAA